jgi:hypothetical protein
MDELLVKLKNKYTDLTLSIVHLGIVVRDITLKHDYDMFQKQDIKNLL